MKESAKNFAIKNGMNLEQLNKSINKIYIHVDCIERDLTDLKSEFGKLGASIPSFTTDVNIILNTCRSMVRMVNKHCELQDAENFGHDADAIYEAIENLLINKNVNKLLQIKN